MYSGRRNCASTSLPRRLARSGKLIVADLPNREILRGRGERREAADAGRWCHGVASVSPMPMDLGVQYANRSTFRGDPQA